MGYIRDFKGIFKPTAVWGFIFISLSVLFIGTFVFFEHQIYRSSYQKTQRIELNSLQKKTGATLRNLKELAHLTNVRIAASHGDLKRIENILNSVPSLYPGHAFPRIKGVSYEKFSYPQMIISRFGTKKLPPERIPPKNLSANDDSIVFDKDNVISKSFVFNKHNTLEGSVEIQIDLISFKAFLMDLKTLSFAPNTSAKTALQNDPLPVYAKDSLNFWSFLILNQSRYWVPLF